MNINLETIFLDDLNRNIKIVHRVCNIFLTGKNEERDDLFQEIMYQLWKSYPSFNGESKFTTWMYKVALNTAVTQVKRDRRMPTNERLEEKHQQIAESSDPTNSEERLDRLYAAIAALSDIDKAIILLYLEEHRYEEIADITGLTKTNVSVRLVRIKRTLEERLKMTA